MPSQTPCFSKWASWTQREHLTGLGSPGVYSICVSRTRLHGKAFSWAREICYFGMTNSLGGLRARLRQFDRTLYGAPEHGGADRFRFVHRDYEAVLPRLYVAVHPVAANVASPTPRDLRGMGIVASLEYQCLARFLSTFATLPRFNQRDAPKYSSAE